MQREKVKFGDSIVNAVDGTFEELSAHGSLFLKNMESNNLVKSFLFHYPAFDFQSLLHFFCCAFAIKNQLGKEHLSKNDSFDEDELIAFDGDELTALFKYHITPPKFNHSYDFFDFSSLYTDIYLNVKLDDLIRDLNIYLYYNHISETTGTLGSTLFSIIQEKIDKENPKSILVSTGPYFTLFASYLLKVKKKIDFKIHTTNVIGQLYYQLLSIRNPNIQVSTEQDIDRISPNEKFDLIIALDNNSIKNKPVKGKLEYKEFSRNLNLFCFANLIKNLNKKGEIVGFWSDETLISENYNKAFKDYIKSKIIIQKIKKISADRINNLIISPYQVEASFNTTKELILEDTTLTENNKKKISYSKFADNDSFSFVQHFENVLKGKTKKLSSMIDIIRGATFGTNQSKGKYQTISTSALTNDGISYSHLPFVTDADLSGKKVENYVLKDLDLIIVIRSSTIKIEVFLEKFADHKILCNTTQVALRFHNPVYAVFYKLFFSSSYGLKLLESLSRSGKSKAYNINPTAIGELQVPDIDEKIAAEYSKKYIKFYEEFYSAQKKSYLEHFKNQEILADEYKKISSSK